jgi:hypothetical protein
MNLSSKHQQNIVTYGDFTGGLNTTTVPAMIAENQMADCTNMEFNRTTGALQTCCGTATVFKCPDDITIDKLFYDEINNIFIFTDDNTKAVYKSSLVDIDGTHSFDRERIGFLSGNKTASAVMWDKGLLIVSGGRLQYWDGSSFDAIKITFQDEMNSYSWESVGTSLPSGTTASDFTFDTYYTKNESYVSYNGEYYLCKENHTSVSDSPSKCNGVFVKNGRVYTWYEYRLQCSGVGDARCWYDVSSDDSTSKWIDIGYKEGDNEQAYITGACALSSDIVVIKNDGKIYRLAGDYPDWSLKEIARNITCINSHCFTAIQDGVFIVGREGMFFLQTTVDYGEMKPTNVANGILSLLSTLSVEKSWVKFLPALNQIWIAGYENKFICFDLTFKAFFQRKFYSAVNDICVYKSYFMLARNHSVGELVDGIYQDEKYSDNESDMDWEVTAKSHTDFYDFLLKRIRVTYVPLLDSFDTARMLTAENKIHVDLSESQTKSPEIYADNTLIVDDDSYVVPMNTQFNTKWCVYRNRMFGVKLKGQASAVMLNKIDIAVAEV